MEFIDEVKIEEIKFIRNTKYIYYKLYNINKNIYYYGIIDVVLNKVIFNTDEQFKLFIPYSNNAMLAMTSDKLYKICMIYNNNDCTNKCPEGKKLVFDVNNKNICKDSITCSNYILKPNDICMDTCDLSIYTSNEKKECGLCKDINQEKPYKIINSTNCFQSQPNNTVFINEQLKLLRCSNGYKLENGECISMNCYSTCD